MTFAFTPFISALVLLVGATLVGMAPVVKLIRIYEGHHELKQGSAGWLRTIGGWSMIAFWLMSTWFLATIVGDWAVSGDLQGAVDRSWLRLRILFEIASSIASSD